MLLVHASFREVRPVEGGPLGLIRALRRALGPEGTLVMPSWTADGDTAFKPLYTPAASDLGVIADTFWRLPGVVRSRHPFAFAAAGPWAEWITGDPLPLPPHRPESPVGRVHELDGQVLLLGVGHDANTTLHLAELIAGVPYRVPTHCTVLEEGRSVRIDYGENDHCCERFRMVDPWLRSKGLQAEGRVGHAHSRLLRSRDVISVSVEQLLRDPFLFLHPRSAGCIECDEVKTSVPKWTLALKGRRTPARRYGAERLGSHLAGCHGVTAVFSPSGARLPFCGLPVSLPTLRLREHLSICSNVLARSLREERSAQVRRMTMMTIRSTVPSPIPPARMVFSG